ncbi:MAG: translation initiation factor IF-2, partial [Kiritimatiellae bacterium]|nr:translation initiation factor IF-2 [Kiritimatiellia bacterium]
HLRLAREAAEGKSISVVPAPAPAAAAEEVGGTAPAAATAPEAADASARKPAIRMAPGHKAKPLPAVSAAQTGLTKAGFKPLQKARPVAAISISVAAPPKQRPPKPAATDFDDFEKGNRKGKKDREGQKSFDKRAARSAAPAAAPAQPGSRISVDASTKEVSIRGAVVVKDFAAKLGIKPNRLIADLMGLKILASINQRIEPDVATKVAEKYGFKVTIEHARDKAAAKPVLKAIDADDLIPEDPPESLQPRAPVVTFLGHVDHGKTTLMDWIRKEHVAQGEAGGITQQISAYQVEVAGKRITFLDTPGHAAFSAMRARGAQITDIAVLIIAADDGIMPQTEECIRVARQAGVQIMVAITKVDKPTANADRVKQQLQKAGLTPEDWGGDIICCPVSGVTGEGVDALLENILVQAEVLELQANPNRRANGYVIESELQQGLGPCATLLVTGGTLKVGDAILIGEHFGRVRALIDDHGRRVKEAPPATPVKCTGLSGVPDAGSEFRVMLDEKRARTLAAEAAQERKEQELAASKAMTLDALMSRMAAEGKRELNVIVKSDTQGSLEAIVQTLGEIKSEKVGLNVIGAGTGNVSLTDVTSAAAGKAVVVGFDIGCDAGVQQKARHDGVRINSFRIIYELVDHVKNCMLDLLPPEYKEVVKGHAEIKAIYDIGKLGKIAGSQMLNGSLVAKERFRILRGKTQVWDGKVQTLRHFKDEVKEVTGQQECGVCFAGYEDFQVGDVIECYLLEELPRSL